jgi:hypothetical protein
MQNIYFDTLEGSMGKQLNCSYVDMTDIYIYILVLKQVSLYMNLDRMTYPEMVLSNFLNAASSTQCLVLVQSSTGQSALPLVQYFLRDNLSSRQGRQRLVLSFLYSKSILLAGSSNANTHFYDRIGLIQESGKRASNLISDVVAFVQRRCFWTSLVVRYRLSSTYRKRCG